MKTPLTPIILSTLLSCVPSSAVDSGMDAPSPQATPAAALRALPAPAERLECAPDRPCWTWMRERDGDTLERARRAQLSAERLRDTNPAVLLAEVAACDGVSDLDMELSPFVSRSDIVSVAPAAAEPYTMAIAFGAVEGLDERRLAAIVRCHVARNEAAGHSIPENRFCPLDVPGVRATVVTHPVGWVVMIGARDEAGFMELRRRAEALARPSAGPDAP